MNRQKQLTGFEIHRLIEENQSIIGARVDKIFQNNNRLMIRVRQKSEETANKSSIIFTIPSYFLIKGDYQRFNDELSNFGSILRKRLNNSILKGIKQVGFDRIIILEFSGREEYRLIIELFDKGALILTNSEGTIINSSSKENAKRNFRIGEKYELPNNTIKNPLTYEFCQDVLKKKKEIVKILASDFGLGRIYAEELCSRARIDKLKIINPAECSVIRDKLKGLNDEKENIIIFKNKEPMECSCVDIHLPNIEKEEFDNFSEALSKFYYLKEKEQDKKKVKKSKEEVIIEQQTKQLERLRSEIEENRRKGEKIYEHYNEIKEIIKKVNEMIHSKADNKEKKRKIKSIKMNNLSVKEINFKDKKITLHFGDKNG